MTPDDHATDERVAECGFCDALTIAELSQVLKNSDGEKEGLAWRQMLKMPPEFVLNSSMSPRDSGLRSLCLISRYRQLMSDVSMLTVMARMEGSREPAGREEWVE